MIHCKQEISRSITQDQSAKDEATKGDDAAMQKLEQVQTRVQAERAALMEQRKANEKIALPNKAETTRLEIGRALRVDSDRVRSMAK